MIKCDVKQEVKMTIFASEGRVQIFKNDHCLVHLDLILKFILKNGRKMNQTENEQTAQNLLLWNNPNATLGIHIKLPLSLQVNHYGPESDRG